jgi:hypothetical protein
MHALRWLVVAFAVSLLGAFEGSHLMASLNESVPGVLDVLHANADPAPAHPHAPARRVVVALVDGLGGDAFDALVRGGALGDVPWRVSLDSGVPSRSRPVYHAILTGTPQWASGIRGNGYATGRADSVPDRVRAAGGRVAWMLEAEPWFCELFCASGDLVVEGPQVTSPETFLRVWSSAPDLIVLHLTDVDEAGHLRGAASREYDEASRTALATVAKLHALAQARPGGAGTIWFVGADHGHTSYGGHGGPEEAVRRVSWVALYDATTQREGGDSGDGAAQAMTPVTSLASTFARALGVDAPRESMADGLPLLPSLLGAPLHASAARIEAVQAARRTADARLLGSPGPRAWLIGSVLAATLAGLVVLRGRRGLAEACVFVVAVTGFLVVGPGLSMSDVRTERSYLVHGLVTLAIFAGLAWTVARRWASALVVAATCVVFPVLALVAMRGSLGRSDVSSLESVLWPSLGLVPPSVCTAIAIVEMGAMLMKRRPPRTGIASAVRAGAPPRA